MRRNTKRTISLLVVCTMLVSTVGFAVPVFSMSESMNPDNLSGSETSVELSEENDEKSKTDTDKESKASEEKVSEDVEEYLDNESDETMSLSEAPVLTYGVLSYTVDENNEVTITDCEADVTSVEIPAQIDGMDVVAIGFSAFYGCENLKEIEIPKKVKIIGGTAFSGCTSLEKVGMADNDEGYLLESIEWNAFSGCRSLTSLTIPEGVKYLGNYMISGTAISSITIPKTVETASGALGGCETLKEVIFEEGIEEIPASVCISSAIEKVAMPESVTSIGSSAFYGCENLKEIEIPKKVKIIGGTAFSGCTSLEKVGMADNDEGYLLESIEWNAFSGCRSLTSLTIPEGVKYLGNYMISGTAISSITIPKTVETASGALGGCETLKEVIFEEGIEEIPASVCISSAIEKVAMPESVTSIGSSAFYSCENLKDVYYAGSEEEWLKISIGSYNENLTNATIHYNSTMPDSADPGSEDEEYFAILKDNNCWRHSEDSFFGENEEHRYLISDDYFQQLLRQVGKHSVESSVLYWDRNSEWKGSCFGLTIAMSLANIGDLYDVTHGRDFYRLGAPKDIEEEPELRNVINYFQLMQKIIDPDLLTYKDNVTNGILNGADKETFLKLLVQEAKNSEKTHSPFVFTYCYNYRDYLSKDECESLGIKGKGGHSVVVCGYQYAKNADGNYEHQIQIYDPNDLGRYYYLYIEEDYSSFDYQDFLMHDHTMNLGSQYDKEIRLEYIYDWMGFYGIDCLKNMENTRISKPVIPATDNLNQSIELHSDPDEINTEQVKLFISLDHPFVLKNAKGETLSYDGEKFDGTMKVYASKMIGEENLEMILSTDASDSFSITSTDSNFEIAAEIDENCYIVSSDGADSARLSKENGVVLEGDVYTFSAAAGTDLESCEMVKFSGKGSGLCNLKQTKEGIQLDTENNSFSDVTVETYKGMDYNSEKVDGKAEYVSVTDGEEGETVIETDGTVSDDNQGSNENEYKINSLQILDGDGQALENIPAGEFYVDADLSKSDKVEDAVLVLAAYDSDGKMVRLYCEKLGDAETAETDAGNTVSRKIRVENPDGEVAEVRTFVLRSLGMPVSLCPAVSVGNDSAIG